MRMSSRPQIYRLSHAMPLQGFHYNNWAIWGQNHSWGSNAWRVHSVEHLIFPPDLTDTKLQLSNETKHEDNIIKVATDEMYKSKCSQGRWTKKMRCTQIQCSLGRCIKSWYSLERWNNGISLVRVHQFTTIRWRWYTESEKHS